MFVITILHIIISLFFLSLIIFVHEMFHLLAAKMLKIKASAFAVGFGPSIFVFQKTNVKSIFKFFPSKTLSLDENYTSYHLKLIPLGGFVNFAKTNNGILEDGLIQHKPWKRIIVAAAGPIGNFIFAIALTAGLLLTISSKIGVEVESVLPGSLAETLHIQQGDYIKAINHTTINTPDDIKTILSKSQNACVTIDRNGKNINACGIVPKTNSDVKLGISLFYVSKNDQVTIANVIPKSIDKVVNLSGDYTKGFLTSVLHLQVKDLSGPVGVVDTMQQTVSDTHSFIFLLSFINVALGVMNLLFPSSVTDGGRIVVDLIAMLRRKHSISTKYIDILSLCLVLLLFISTTVLDLRRLFGLS